MKNDLAKTSMEFVNGFSYFFRSRTRSVFDSGLSYMRGLLGSERGDRNIERMCEKTGSDYERQQYLITDSNWDSAGLLKSIAKKASTQLQSEGLVGCSVDEKAHLKQGSHSVGVARQYAGVIGKVDNCQVGVYLSLCAGKYATLSNLRLYLPREWTDDKKRIKKAGVPKDKQSYKTKPELALEMIKEHIAEGVDFDYVNGDGLYGNSYTLSKGLNALEVPYVLEVHNNQRIFTDKPTIGVPKKQTGSRGAKPTRLKADKPGIKIRDYVQGIVKEDFEEVYIRQTTKGWSKALIHVKKIWVWDEAAADTEPICQTLVVRKPLKQGDKPKYSLSNISPEAATHETFAFMQAQRFWVERCFRDDSQEIGMSDYQVRKWKGWHNHMIFSFFAMLFIMEQRIKYKEKAPLLSYNDVRKLLVSIIFNRAKDFDNVIEQLEKRHQQRAKDIARYYQNQQMLI